MCARAKGGRVLLMGERPKYAAVATRSPLPKTSRGQLKDEIVGVLIYNITYFNNTNEGTLVAYHSEVLLRDGLHLQQSRLDVVIARQGRVYCNPHLFLLPRLQCTPQCHTLAFELDCASRKGAPADLGVNCCHFGTGDWLCHFPVPFCVCNQSVWVAGHVHPQESRFVGHRIRHSVYNVEYSQSELSEY